MTPAEIESACRKLIDSLSFMDTTAAYDYYLPGFCKILTECLATPSAAEAGKVEQQDHEEEIQAAAHHCTIIAKVAGQHALPEQFAMILREHFPTPVTQPTLSIKATDAVLKFTSNDAAHCGITIAATNAPTIPMECGCSVEGMWFKRNPACKIHDYDLTVTNSSVAKEAAPSVPASEPRAEGEELPDGDGFWIRREGDWRIVTGEMSHSHRDAYAGWRGGELVNGLFDYLPRGNWLKAVPDAAEVARLKNILSGVQGALADAETVLAMREDDDYGESIRELTKDRNTTREALRKAEEERDAVITERELVKIENMRAREALETILRVDLDRDWTKPDILSKPPRLIAGEFLNGHKTVMQQRWEWQGEEIQKQIKRAESAEQRCADLERQLAERGKGP